MSETFPRVAIVTGATSGFGRATVRKFISAGFGVIGSGRNQSCLESMEKQSETRFAWVAGDASDERVIDRLFTTAADRFGQRMSSAASYPYGYWGNAHALSELWA